MSYKACNGEVFAGAKDATPATAVGFVNGYNYAETAEEIEVSVMGNCNKQYLGGAVEGVLTLDGFSRHTPGTNPAQDPGQALFIPGNQISLAIQPNGTGSGKPRLEWVDATITGRTFAGVFEGAPTWNVVLRTNVAVDDAAQV